MTQDQLFSKLSGYLSKRGALRVFCRDHNLPYSKVWKFAAGQVKEVTYEFGKALASAIESAEVANATEKEVSGE